MHPPQFPTSRRAALKTLLAALGAGYGLQAAAADAYPSRPVELVVPYPPGGSTDVVARMYQAKLSPLLGQPMIVDNRAGASGNIGTAYVARSPADGQRLLLSTSAVLTVNPHIYKNPGFDPFKDFAPVSLICGGALAVAVGAQTPVKTLQELVAYAKRKPKGVFYGTPSSGTPQHLMGELLNQVAGIDMTPVHYKGVAPAITDLLGGTVQVVFSTFAALKPQLDGGKLRILAVAEPRRLRNAPNIPTIAEVYPGFEMSTWFGIFAPARTPQPVIAKLQQDFTQVTAIKEVQDLLESFALPPVGGSAQQLAHVLRRDYDKVGKLIRDKGITVD
jgi:tripartite-type tricarboxylate transporter receptor subunit TctC